MTERHVIDGHAGDWEVNHFHDDENPWTTLELYDADAEERNNDGEQVCVYSLLLSDVEAAQLAAALTNRSHDGGGEPSTLLPKWEVQREPDLPNGTRAAWPYVVRKGDEYIRTLNGHGRIIRYSTSTVAQYVADSMNGA